MTTSKFREHLDNSLIVLLEMTRQYCYNDLFENCKFVLQPSGTDFHNGLTDFEKENLVNLNRFGDKVLSAEQVVDVLCHDNKVPLWIDITVHESTKKLTIVHLFCSRRLRDDNELFYHAVKYPPFHVLVPIPPDWLRKEINGKFDINWKNDLRHDGNRGKSGTGLNDFLQVINEIKNSMQRLPRLLLSCFLLTLSCTKSKVNQSGGVPRTPEENQIFEMAYNINYVYPPGFYKDDSGYYENTVSIKPPSQREIAWIELSTNDRKQALAWSDSSNEYSSTHGAIISERETEKYFEFTRQSSTNSKDVGHSRIHKANYFIPMLDKFKKGDTIGKYNGQMDANRTKEFVEYIWSCGSAGVFSSKIIQSQMNERNDYFEHYIKSFNIIFGDYGLTDSILVYDNYFRLNKASRILTIASKKVDAFAGVAH